MIPTTALQPLFQALLYSANVELLKDVLSWLQKASNLSKEEHLIVNDMLREYILTGTDSIKKEAIVPAYLRIRALTPQASSPALGMSLLQNYLESSEFVLNTVAFTIIQAISGFSSEAKEMVQWVLSQELIKDSNSKEKKTQLLQVLERFTELVCEERKNDLSKKLIQGNNTKEENERLLRALEEDVEILEVEEVLPQPQIKEEESKKVQESVAQGKANETGTAQKRGETVRGALDETIEKLVSSVVEKMVKKLAENKTEEAFAEALKKTPFGSTNEPFSKMFFKFKWPINAALEKSSEENNEELLEIQEDLLNEVHKATDEYTKIWIAFIALRYPEKQRNKSFEGMTQIGPELKRHICELFTAEWETVKKNLKRKLEEKSTPQKKQKTGLQEEIDACVTEIVKRYPKEAELRRFLFDGGLEIDSENMKISSDIKKKRQIFAGMRRELTNKIKECLSNSSDKDNVALCALQETYLKTINTKAQDFKIIHNLWMLYLLLHYPSKQKDEPLYNFKPDICTLIYNAHKELQNKEVVQVTGKPIQKISLENETQNGAPKKRLLEKFREDSSSNSSSSPRQEPDSPGQFKNTQGTGMTLFDTKRGGKTVGVQPYVRPVQKGPGQK